ncbi:MAG: general secretion pathway protein GspL, partial [Gammaproteobacteria bacterium]
SAQAPFESEAILLPDDLVLIRQLRLPANVETYLDSALALEASANSPFATDDTGYGWQLVVRDGDHLQVVLVIVSISTVMAYLARQYDTHDPQAQEIWSEVDGAMVLLRGFGEKNREDRYAKRLLRCGLGIMGCALILVLILVAAAGTKRAELLQVEELAANTQREAAPASQMRSSLAHANETIAAVNDIIARYPNPHHEIARLTALLEDGASVAQFSMNGREIRLRGRAQDAAAVMQKLTDEPTYSEVLAPTAIVKVGNTGLEQFSLNITLGDGASG